MSFETQGAIRTEILARFMRGEVDAHGAARELRATLRSDAENEYLVWPQGAWSQELLQAKVAELAAAMQDIPFGRTSRVDHDVPSGAFPFRRADLAERTEVLRRKTLRQWAIWLGPLLIVFLLVFWLPLLLPSLRGPPLVPFLLTFIVVLSAVAFFLGLRGERWTRASGLVCPSCGGLLFGTRRRGALVHLEVLETGRCPQCRTQLLHPAEVNSGASKVST